MSTTSRGYGYAHQALRKRWAARVKRGGVFCARCGFELLPDAEWDLGHDPADRSRYEGPECVRCNRSTALERRLAGSRGFRYRSPAW